MEWVAVVAALALLEYFFFVFMVGQARGRFDIPAPDTTGNPEFERKFRVQENTIEQLVLFLPGLALFAWYVSPGWAAGVGLVFVLGRALYALAYVKDPSRRGPGFGLTLLANAVLVGGGLMGALAAAL